MLNAYTILSGCSYLRSQKSPSLIFGYVKFMRNSSDFTAAVMHALSYCTRSVTSQIKVAMTKVLACGSFSGRDSSAHFRKKSLFSINYEEMQLLL